MLPVQHDLGCKAVSLSNPRACWVLTGVIRAYLRHCRQQAGQRLVEKCYDTDTGAPSKYWVAFAQKKFLNKSLT